MPRPLAASAFPDGLQIDVLVRVIHAGFHIGLAVTIIINAIEIAREAYRLKARGRVPADHAPAHSSQPIARG